MSTKILVLHPCDPTTRFLCEIYEDIDCRFITDFSAVSDEDLKNIVRDYDTVIMLGHGTEKGLYDKSLAKYVIDDSFADILRGKDIIGIWCHANIYFLNNDLEGFRTGMFISEEDEAGVYGVDSGEDGKDIEYSNELFARIVSEGLRGGHELNEWVDRNYVCEDNEVISANRAFLFG